MSKRISAILAVLLIVTCVIGGGFASAAEIGVNNHITVNSYDPYLDYMGEINKVLQDGGSYAMQIGGIYEKQRNLKIDTLGLKQKKTSYFSTYNTASEILKAIEDDKKPKYSDEDLYWLSRVIDAEAGSNWIPDWVQRGVGSVVLNRVASSRFPNSIKSVVFQSGQYHCASSGSIYRTPSTKSTNNAKYILENGSTLPAGVLGQSEHIQGIVHSTYYDPYLGTTTYFCYM